VTSAAGGCRFVLFNNCYCLQPGICANFAKKSKMETWIKALFRDVIENEQYDEQLVCRYFSPDYIQVVDQQALDFEAFKKHVRKLKEKVQRVEVVFLNIASNETSVLTRHRVTSHLRNGAQATHLVFAEFQVADGQVVRCEELTRLLEGDESAAHLGSDF